MQDGSDRFSPDPAAPQAPDADVRAERGVGERRRYRRARVLWGGVLRVDSPPGQVACTVSDISAGGAKLLVPARPQGGDAEVLDALERGDAVVLSLRDSGEVPGTVVWQQPGRVGVQFRLPAAEVRARFPGVVPAD